MAGSYTPIRPYNPSEELYDKELWGAERAVPIATDLHMFYGVATVMSVTLQCDYHVNARYKNTEPTIEDIYSCVTMRYMSLGCLDGPLFPYYSSGTGEG